MLLNIFICFEFTSRNETFTHPGNKKVQKVFRIYMACSKLDKPECKTQYFPKLDILCSAELDFQPTVNHSQVQGLQVNSHKI